MEIKEAVPYLGKSIYQDMVSNSVSAEGRASASRRYIEMIIDLFLSKELKEDVGEEKFYKMPLGERIKGVSKNTSNEVIDTLYRIKDYGDKASHFNPNTTISDNEVEKVTKDALGIFELILVDYFRKNSFHKTFNTAVIFSTLFPEIRANVLSHFVNKVFIRKQADREILHKYIIALVKSNRVNKAKRVLNDFKKKGVIDQIAYKSEMGAIKHISEGMKNDRLPIPVVIEDCKRNFENALNDISIEEQKENEGLISIIATLLHQYSGSEMGDLTPNKIYHFEIEIDVL